MKEASFGQRVLGNICEYDFLLYWALIFEIVLLLFATIAFVFGDLDRETELILLLDFVLLGFVLAVTVGLIRLCGRRH